MATFIAVVHLSLKPVECADILHQFIQLGMSAGYRESVFWYLLVAISKAINCSQFG